MADLMTTTATFLDGVTLLANAIPDLALVIDSPDCGDDKVAKAGIRSDIFSTLNQPGLVNRQQFTWLTFPDLALGSEAKVLDTIRTIDKRLRPGAILLTAGSPVQLTGEYHGMSASLLTQELGKPVVPLTSASLSGDYLDGFGNALAALLEHLPLAPLPPVPGTVGIVGLPFERSEEDHLGNIRELERLLAGIGLNLTVVAPSGRNLMDMMRLASVEYLVGFPHGSAAASIVAHKLQRPLIQTVLPMGMDGTARWVQQIAAATQRQQQAEPFIQAELDACVQRLRRVVRTMFVGKRAVVVLDPYIAQALIPALSELGIQIAALNLRTRSQDRVREVSPMLNEAQSELIVAYDLSFPALADQWKRQVEQGVDFVVGTTMERTVLDTVKRPYLELGFPCYVRHALFDSPWMGFRGLLWLANHIYNMLSAYRYDHPGSMP